MTIETPSPPDRAITAAREGTMGLAPPPGGGLRAAMVEGANVLAAPLECYALQLRPGDAVTSLSYAYPTGWRFMVRAQGEPIAVSEVNGADEDTRFAKLDPASSATRMFTAVSRLEERLEERADAYRIRFLRVPSLNTACLWAHSDSPEASDEILTLLTGGGPPSADGDIIPAEQFLERLTDLSERFHSSLDGPIGG